LCQCEIANSCSHKTTDSTTDQNNAQCNSSLKIRITWATNCVPPDGLEQHFSEFDVHESVHRDTTMKITNKMHYTD
jgi:hypothetical protein